MMVDPIPGTVVAESVDQDFEKFVYRRGFPFSYGHSSKIERILEMQNIQIKSSFASNRDPLVSRSSLLDRSILRNPENIQPAIIHEAAQDFMIDNDPIDRLGRRFDKGRQA